MEIFILTLSLDGCCNLTFSSDAFLFGIRKKYGEKYEKVYEIKKNIKRPQYFDCAKAAYMLESESALSLNIHFDLH